MNGQPSAEPVRAPDLDDQVRQARLAKVEQDQQAYNVQKEINKKALHEYGEPYEQRVTTGAVHDLSHDAFDPRGVESVKKVVQKTKKGARTVAESTGGIVKNLSLMLGGGWKALMKESPKMAFTRTVGFVLGGIGFALLGVKNLVKFLKVSVTQTEKDQLPGVSYLAQFLAQLTAAAGLTATFIGAANPFQKVENGKTIVPPSLLAGGIAVPVIFGEVMKVVKNKSIINKIPVFGRLLKEVLSIPFDAVKFFGDSETDKKGSGGGGANPLAGLNPG